MSYSRKHFKDVATIISQFADEIPQTTLEDLIGEFSDLFMAYNDKFDQEKFAQACVPPLGG